MKGAGCYTAYGLLIRSEIPLPHFGAAVGEPDVIVRLGAVPESLSRPRLTTLHWEAAPGDFLLRVEDRFRFRVTGGREVVVERPDGADGLTAAYLMGSVWTALLQQRGLLTLHASAVHSERGATLFLGRSGAGKSTLAAALAARGFNVLTDDVSAVCAAPGEPPRALPGYPNLRLWSDAFVRLGLPLDSRRRVRDGIDKYLLPAKRFAAEAQTIRTAYVLGTGNAEALEFSRKTPAGAFWSFRRHTHRRRLVDGFGNQEANFRTLAHLSRSVPVTLVAQPAKGVSPDLLASRIERHLAENPCP